jgi:uncharacterized membrane protein YdjX (TVP38/TMEM64 family)
MDRAPAPHSSHRWLLLVPVFVVLGLGLAAWQPFGAAELLDMGRQTAALPWLTAVVVLAMALMLSFGLPGSMCLWLIAPFQPPLIATLLLTAGSVGGALGAYAVSRQLRGSWQPAGFALRIVQLLEQHSDLLTQIALRMLPGFPHSVLNFAGGVLRLPLGVFTVSAVLGLAMKWAVYASAVHGVVDALERGTAVQASTIAPLVLMSALLLTGTWAKRRVGG